MDLVGGWLSPTPLKNMSSSIGMIVPNIWENNKVMFQSLPTRWNNQLNPTSSPFWNHPSTSNNQDTSREILRPILDARWDLPEAGRIGGWQGMELFQHIL